MQNYKAPDGSLHVLEDSSFGRLLPAGCVEITSEEAAAIRAALSAPSEEQIRTERNRLLRDVYDPAAHMLLRLQRTAPSELQAAIAAKLAELDAYAQALQDVPEQPGFPHSITWPPIPAKEL